MIRRKLKAYFAIAALLIVGGLLLLWGVIGNFDRTFLILGYRGEGYPEPFYTDAILLVRINKVQKNRSVNVISLPRDLAVDVKGEILKLNSIYAAELKKTASARRAADTLVYSFEKGLGVNIDGHVIIDFSKFLALVEETGGLEVEVGNSFVDYNYPDDETFDYKTIAFEQGKQVLGAARALEYVRSRHAEGEEGSDFARNQRQLKLAQSLIRRIQGMTQNERIDFIRLAKDLLATNTPAGIRTLDLMRLAAFSKNINIQTKFNTIGPELVCPSIGEEGEYMLLLCTADSVARMKNLLAGHSF